jgi:hypothetical protein
MQSVRNQLKTLALMPYDAFSPELMDVIAYHRVKMRWVKQAALKPAKIGPAN